jgi:Pup amidohydrolase
VAVHKVCGIETEYGIHAAGPTELNPIAASSVLINAYVARQERRVGWDFEDESPGRDARGFAREGAMPPEVETHLVNAVLTNGARYYVDHAHPEFSSPECLDATEVVLYDKAGEAILATSMAAANAALGSGQSIVVYKNNSDGKGNSYGTHENYLMDRRVPFERIARHITSHLVSRQIYTGAGKVGSEAPGASGQGVEYQLTQRAEFFEEEVGLETTLKRPIVNTRDEPHADAARYRRLHVIVGDANLAEVATFLKVGVTALVLAMIEDDWFAEQDLRLASPVQALRQVSYDLSLAAPLTMDDGSTMTALELQWELLDRARKYGEDRGLECVGRDGPAILTRWESTLHSLETDPMSLSAQLDWVAKLKLLSAYQERHSLGWDDDRLAAVDLQYHDVRPEKSLFSRLDTERLVTKPQVTAAISEPPRGTRAYFRGRCLAQWSEAIAAANWDSLVFDLGVDPLRRVPMMDPLRGTAAHVDRLLNGCASPTELLDRLDAGT